MSIKSSIILRPILSEKGTLLGEKQNKYVFQVEKKSNKLEIKLCDKRKEKPYKVFLETLINLLFLLI